MPRRDWRLRVADMIDAAETAIGIAKGLERDVFLGDRVLVDAAIKGEAAA